MKLMEMLKKRRKVRAQEVHVESAVTNSPEKKPADKEKSTYDFYGSDSVRYLSSQLG